MSENSHAQKPCYRFKIAWGPYSKGQIFRPDAQYRSVLLQRGIIEPVDSPREVPALLTSPTPGAGRKGRR